MSSAFLVIIPTLAFLALHLVKLRSLPGALPRALGVWLALSILFIFILSQFSATYFYPENAALRAVEIEHQRLDQKPLKKREVVVLIQGSSAASAWINPRLLEACLRRENLPARVFLLSAPGSNHFERLELLREWFARLKPAQADSLQKAQVVMLREVLLTYDENPFMGFAENAFGDRSLAYTTRDNVGLMFRVAFARESPADRVALAPLIISQFLFNAFKVGTIPLVKMTAGAYSNQGRAAAAPAASPGMAFDYHAVIQSFRAQMAKRGAPSSLPNFAWLQIRDDELSRITTDKVDKTAYFTTPHIIGRPSRYEHKYLDQLDQTVVRFDGGSQALLDRLDDAKYWRDSVHATPAGGEVYTRWLAEQIAASWPRISGNAK